MPIPPSPAVLRACDVLDHLAAHPSEAFTVSELARSVGLARASCDSVLLALAERGLVHRGRDRRYSLGAACRALGDAAGAAGAPLAVLEPIADGLARATRSCVAISSASHGETRVEQVFDHGPAFGLRARVGESVPLVPPFGAVFVAWQGDAAIEAWLDRAGHGLGDRERSHLRAALAAARARGYCISVAGVRPELVQMLEELAGEVPDARRRDARDALIHEVRPDEYLPVTLPADGPQQLRQMSAPVFDATGRVGYAFMVLGRSYDVTAAEIDALGARLLDAARAATDELGGRCP
ncbi:MAG TPA: helix-turn-helix domain-containing protein [Acidimicrobiia bacterium]|nr:helix-turn-helix domain-containing protein [Acidimicrobiia bacterium]